MIVIRYRVIVAALFALGLAVCLPGCQSFTSQSLNAEGVRRMNQGDVQQAEDLFLRARSTNPSDADACYNLAIIEHKRALSCRNADNFSRAEEYYRLALDRNPSHVDAYRGLAALYCDENRVNDAFALLENWNRQELGSVEPKIELARLYNEYNRVDQAEMNLRQALAMDPQNVRALNSMAYVYEQKQMYAEASMMYCKSLQLMPTQTAIAQRRCQLDRQSTCGTCSSAPATQIACNAPAPAAAPVAAPAPACNACASINIPTYPQQSPSLCGPQPQPIEPPGWAITQNNPQVASQTFLGNNPKSLEPTPLLKTATPSSAVGAAATALDSEPTQSASAAPTLAEPTPAQESTVAHPITPEKVLPGRPVAADDDSQQETELY